MNIPNWAKYMMLIASAIGAYLLAKELASQGWPNPIGGIK